MTSVLVWHCLIYCLLFILLILPIGFINPRIMLQDYPSEIQASVAPKTKRERRQTVFFAIPLVFVMIGYPAIVSFYYRPSDPTFSYFFFTMWAMMLVFNVFDLLILDWIVFCTITPRFIIVEGTEGHPGYKNYKFHFIGFLKGIGITGLICAVFAGILLMFTKL